MNRRQFIIAGSTIFMMAGGTAMFDSLGQLQPVHRVNRLADIAGLTEATADILYLAALAPSGHNTQPWTVRLLTGQHWRVGTNTDRWLPVVDPDNRETMISVGAFLENLVTAAAAKGYAADVQAISPNPKDKEILDVNLHTAGQMQLLDRSNLELRRTIRNGFLNTALSPDDIRFLTEGNKDIFFYFPRESTEGRYLTDKTIAANIAQTSQNSAQLELANWIRWSNKEQQQYGNGLTAETMEITGLARWYVKNFYTRQSVMEDAFREATIKRIQEQAAAGSGWLVLASKDWSVPSLIDLGRRLQRIWLLIRDRNIAFHPMNQLTEDAIARNELSSTLGIAGNVQMLIRVGYVSQYPLPVSPRMPLQKFVTTA